MAFHRVVVQYEILCPNDDEHEALCSASLADIHYMTMEGDCSGRFLDSPVDMEISPKEAAKILMEQGSDPEFFGIDEEGNEIEE